MVVRGKNAVERDEQNWFVEVQVSGYGMIKPSEYIKSITYEYCL